MYLGTTIDGKQASSSIVFMLFCALSEVEDI